MVLVLRRVAILLSATFLSLTAGTLYLYSAYSPQLALQLKYTASDASKIVMVGSLGSFMVGPPVGLIIDTYGYMISLICGGACLVSGYYGLQYQFDHQLGKVWLSSFFMFLIGSGSTFVGSSCMKKCAVNFPAIRGLATSLPLSMIGLSASFYSIVGSTFFPGNTSSFLKFLWVSCLVITIICAPLVCGADLHNHQQLQAARISIESQSIELEDMSSASITPGRNNMVPTKTSAVAHSRASVMTKAHPIFENNITGLQLIKNVDFWLLCVILCIFAGMGQMYIYSVGYIVKALFGDSKFILAFPDLRDYEMLLQQSQQLQVTMISVSNSVGRIGGGVMGDLITTSYNKSRSYLLILSAACLTMTQLDLYFNHELGNLWYASLIVGFFYGFNYSVYPTLVGDKFGMKNFSLNYGVVGMAPTISNYLLNKRFGAEYDSNISKIALTESSELVSGSFIYVCELGNRCYNGVFLLTSVLAIIGLFFVLTLNYRQFLEERRSTVAPKVV